MSNKDKRRHPRIQIQLEVELTPQEQEALTLQTGNISHSGLYLLAGGQPLPEIGSEVYVRLKQTLGEGEQAPLVKGRVVRVEGDGIGVHFEEADPS